MGGLPESTQLVVRDEQAWGALWLRLSGQEPPPVDFSRWEAVGVFMGVKPTGGYGITIDEIRRTKKTRLVFYKEQTPRRGYFVIQAFTSPYHIKLIERSDLSVAFKKRR